jgi:hypothetical protein
VGGVLVRQPDAYLRGGDALNLSHIQLLNPYICEPMQVHFSLDADKLR